jgi:FkbM family methyltransferase
MTQPRRVMRRIAERALGVQGYQWHSAASIRRQEFVFHVNGGDCSVTADHTTPLYDTIREIVDYDCYQLAKLPAPPAEACVVDVGANIGVATIVLSATFGLPVYSFEPMAANVERLKANVAANGLAGVTVVPKAIGARTGVIQADITWEASVSPRASATIAPATDHTTPIEMLSLTDALAQIPEPVFLMKLDCEGAEFEIVDQLDAASCSRIGNLTFEVHDQGPNQNLGSMGATMRSLGYTTELLPEMRGRDWMGHLLARGG